MGWITLDRKVIAATARDPIRLFVGPIRELLEAECGGRCSNPFCDLPQLTPLAVHHILAHARGGPTTEWNGLVLCERCHTLLHGQCVPMRLAWHIKQIVWRSDRSDPGPGFSADSADALIASIRYAVLDGISVSDRFALVNDILISAHRLRDVTERHRVFAECLLAKASLLSDRVAPVRRDLAATIRAMDHRRRWSNHLTACAMNHARNYAARTGDLWLVIRALHCRAVGENARHRFGRSADYFGRALRVLDAMPQSAARQVEMIMFRGRVERERGAVLAKASSRSRQARDLVLNSMARAESIGDGHDMADAQIRCCEALTLLGELTRADAFLCRLRSSKGLDTNLSAIATKLEARLLAAQNRPERALEACDVGLRFATEHRICHQQYHFVRLASQLRDTSLVDRERWIT